MSPDVERAFLTWVLRNFVSKNSHYYDSKSSSSLYNYFLPGNDIHANNAYTNATSGEFYIKGETIKNYLDYLELQEARKVAQEARESSNKAIKIAQWSLFAAIFAALLPFSYTICKDNSVKENATLIDNYTEVTLEEMPIYEPEQLKVSKDMKLDEFVQLSQLKQYEIVFNEGKYVGDVREENKIFALYSVGFFWVEVTYDSINNKILRLKPLNDVKSLKKFTKTNS